MQKLKTKEEEIVTSIKDGNTEDLNSFKLLAIYFCISDELKNSTHLTNIKRVYGNKNDDGFVKISEDLFTNERTLERYRKQYLKCFEICGSVLNRLDEVLNFVNKLK